MSKLFKIAKELPPFSVSAAKFEPIELITALREREMLQVEKSWIESAIAMELYLRFEGLVPINVDFVSTLLNGRVELESIESIATVVVGIYNIHKPKIISAAVNTASKLSRGYRLVSILHGFEDTYSSAYLDDMFLKGGKLDPKLRSQKDRIRPVLKVWAAQALAVGIENQVDKLTKDQQISLIRLTKILKQQRGGDDKLW